MTEQPFKLALRTEGKWWVAYVAIAGAGSVEVCRIVTRIAEEDPAVKQMFIDLAKLAVTKVLTATGHTVEAWNDPVRAPESERSGNA